MDRHGKRKKGHDYSDQSSIRGHSASQGNAPRGIALPYSRITTRGNGLLSWFDLDIPVGSGYDYYESSTRIITLFNGKES